jgi:hypothetical protein
MASPAMTPLVGSKDGKLYHREDCEWVRKISLWNLIYFDSHRDAVAKGYGACLVCCPAADPEAQQQLRSLTVRVGSKFTVQYEDGAKRTFEMVSAGTVDPDPIKVPRDSSLGKSAFGSRVGDKRIYFEGLRTKAYIILAID